MYDDYPDSVEGRDHLWSLRVCYDLRGHAVVAPRAGILQSAC